MKIAHILVCFSTDPTKAIESIPQRDGAVWYVFLHSDNAQIEATVNRLMADRDGHVFDFKVNRGLARSWNDGIHLAMLAGCEAIILLNDDLFFYDGRYDDFLHTIRALKDLSRDVGYATPLGLESGTSAHSGQILAQQFACCAITPECVDRVGYFDENFSPAYYEDIDYDRRVRLSGMLVHVHQAVLVEHDRSSTHRSLSLEEKLKADAQFLNNKAYFERKWGLACNYSIPFNDNRANLYIAFADRSKPYHFADAAPQTDDSIDTETEEIGLG